MARADAAFHASEALFHIMRVKMMHCRIFAFRKVQFNAAL